MVIHGIRRFLQVHLIHGHGFTEEKRESQRTKGITNDGTAL